MSDEMIVYFSSKTIDCEIPENIITQVRDTFSKFEVVTSVNGNVTVNVPKREKELADKFKNDVYNLLLEIKKENSVLAGKLARKNLK